MKANLGGLLSLAHSENLFMMPAGDIRLLTASLDFIQKQREALQWKDPDGSCFLGRSFWLLESGISMERSKAR